MFMFANGRLAPALAPRGEYQHRRRTGGVIGGKVVGDELVLVRREQEHAPQSTACSQTFELSEQAQSWLVQPSE